MGEELISSPHEHKTIEQVFNEACPCLMAIGMSYDDFWYKDPMIAKAYIEADKIRRKRKNEELWLQGYYNYIAFSYITPVLQFGAKRGTKIVPYPSEPIALSQEELERNKEIERQNRLNNLKQKLIKSSTKKKEG